MNLILFPYELEEETKQKIIKNYKEKESPGNTEYHISEYSAGTLGRSFIDLKELYNINNLVCIAYKKEIKKTGRAFDWMKCGLDKEKVRIIELEGDKEKDRSKLEMFLEE